MVALRELDGLMKAQRAAGLLATGTRGQLVGRGVIGGVSETPPIDRPITLDEAGIDKNLAKRARELGAKSDEEFRIFLAKAKQKQRDAKALSARLPASGLPTRR
jgi:hypothetical protein